MSYSELPDSVWKPHVPIFIWEDSPTKNVFSWLVGCHSFVVNNGFLNKMIGICCIKFHLLHAAPIYRRSRYYGLTQFNLRFRVRKKISSHQSNMLFHRANFFMKLWFGSKTVQIHWKFKLSTKLKYSIITNIKF